jgi:hypothetical protein
MDHGQQERLMIIVAGFFIMVAFFAFAIRSARKDAFRTTCRMKARKRLLKDTDNSELDALSRAIYIAYRERGDQ